MGGLPQPRDRGLIPSATGLELAPQEEWSGAPTSVNIAGDTNAFGEVVIPILRGEEIEWLSLGFNLRSTGTFTPTFLALRLAAGDGTGLLLEFFPISVGGGLGAAVAANTDIPVAAVPPPNRMKWNSFDQLRQLAQQVQPGVTPAGVTTNWRLQALLAMAALGAGQTFTFTIRARCQRFRVSS